MSSSNRIRHIVRIHQMLKRWRRKARESSTVVPAGHVAVCVGPSRRRYAVRATVLNHPAFRDLLSRAEEEYGFSAEGPLAIPNCDESTFEEILRSVSSTRCHVGVGLVLNTASNAGESWPLLRG